MSVLIRPSCQPTRRVLGRFGVCLNKAYNRGVTGTLAPPPPSYAGGLWVKFVVGSQLAEGFSLSTLVFLSPRKTKLLFDLTRIED